jgi:predicted metal-binding protein
MTTTIYVCTTCKTPDDSSPIRAGARLFTSLQEAAQTHQSDVIIEGVECLSVCKRPCTIAFTDQNKWTYVYGDFTADDSAEQILACASLYAHAADGLIPWKERPDALKKGVIARLPASLTSSRSPETQQ